MLQYVMTKLETHNINSDGQIMPNHIEQVSFLTQFNLHKYISHMAYPTPFHLWIPFQKGQILTKIFEYDISTS